MIVDTATLLWVIIGLQVVTFVAALRRGGSRSNDDWRTLRVERKLDLILKELDITYRDDTPDLVRELLAGGRKIEAIKMYREATGVGLKEAKDAVDAIEQVMPPAPLR